jgi:hypothetical protein
MNIPPSLVQVQLKSILAQYASMPVVGGAPGIATKQEQAIITRILEEAAWQQLSDAAKQEKRKSTLALLDKWSYEEGTGSDISYEISVVALYDCMEEVLATMVEDTPNTIRLKGALLVEKFFINEQPEFSKMRHFDIHAWNAIVDHSQQADGGLPVAVLDGLFKQMYFKWPKRPYKDAL